MSNSGKVIVKIVAVILMVTLFSISSPAGDITVKSYILDVTFTPEAASMEGVADITFTTPLKTDQTYSFYLHGELRVNSIQSNGKKLEFDQELVLYGGDYSAVAKKITFSLSGATASSITVHYLGQLNPSVVRSPSNYMRVDPSGVYLRAYYYSVWFPIFQESGEDPYNVDFPKVTIRTPQKFKAVFTGTRVREHVTDGMRISEWTSMNTSLIYAQVTAREYEIIRENENYVYHLPDENSRKIAEQVVTRIQKIVDLCKTYYRENALSGQVHVMQMPKYGDISSGNVVGMSPRIWNDFGKDPYSVSTLIHELVHPFTGMHVKNSNPLYSLTAEGFPSYFHLPVMEDFYGEKFYKEYMSRVEQNYLYKKEHGKSRRGFAIPPEKPILEISAGELSRYKDVFILNDRVRLFLNYLRVKMGKTTFTVFTRELFSIEDITVAKLIDLIEKHLPGSRKDVELWLTTNEYPERFRLKQ